MVYHAPWKGLKIVNESDSEGAEKTKSNEPENTVEHIKTSKIHRQTSSQNY